MGQVTAAVAAATMMGPVIGGFITDILGWQYIFYINVPSGDSPPRMCHEKNENS